MKYYNFSVSTLRFDNDSDKKAYPFTLESMLTDCTVKIKKLKDFATMDKEQKKDALFTCVKGNLNKYMGKAINAELKLVLIEKENDFDLDSMLD